MSAVAEFFLEGEIWMWPIVAVSVVGLAVAVERFYVLQVIYNTDAQKLFQKILAALKNNQHGEAVAACDQTGRAALGQVLKHGILHIKDGEAAVTNALDEKITELTPNLQKRVGSLGGLASLATLLGLLGTIMGMIDAFRVVAEAPADQKTTLMTKAIAVAMNTTAFGLMVAIPITIFYLVLSGMSKKIIDDMDVYSLKLENFLRMRRE